MAADNPYKSKRQTGYGGTKPPSGYGPYTPEHPSVVPISPPVKKVSQLPNALEVCEKIQADYLTKLDLIYEAMPTTANRLNRDNYADRLKESCEEKARKMGYFDPINDLRNWIFGGGGDQSFRHSPTSPTWPPYKPRPDGTGPDNPSQMPVPAPTV
jgi:hypothetical protein